LEPLEVVGKSRLQKDTMRFLQQSKSTKGKKLGAAIEAVILSIYSNVNKEHNQSCRGRLN